MIKNPTAVKIGSRIKQARKMAGFETIAQLNTQIPDWSPSRLGNYEAGISIPSPDDIERIAAITHASPCWICFGIGPIRSGSRDLQAIRHQNLAYTVDQLKNKKEYRRELSKFVKHLGWSTKKLDQIINNPFSAISDRAARRCESYLKKTKGWMDEQHVESDPLCMSFPDDIRELMSIYSELEQQERQRLLKIARIHIDQD